MEGVFSLKIDMFIACLHINIVYADLAEHGKIGAVNESWSHRF